MYSRLCEASEIAEDPFKANPTWQKSPPPPAPPVTWPGNVLDSYKQVIRRLHSRQLSGFNVNSSCQGEKPDKSIVCLLSTCWKSTHYTAQTWMKAAGAFWTWENFPRPVKRQWLSLAFPLAECGYFLAAHSRALIDGLAELGLCRPRGSSLGQILCSVLWCQQLGAVGLSTPGPFSGRTDPLTHR